jgi:hypothetical protein
VRVVEIRDLVGQCRHEVGRGGPVSSGVGGANSQGKEAGRALRRPRVYGHPPGKLAQLGDRTEQRPADLICIGGLRSSRVVVRNSRSIRGCNSRPAMKSSTLRSWATRRVTVSTMPMPILRPAITSTVD